MDSRINLNTTTWLFSRDSGEVHQVIEQYRDTYEALGAAYKVMKKALEDEYVYLLYTQMATLSVHGITKTGIAVMSDEAEMGIFIPDSEIDGEIPPVLMVGGQRRPLTDLANLIPN